LADKFESTGHKARRWDKTDQAGQEVASGIYFYRLDAGDLSQTRKMILMKIAYG